MVHPTAKQKKKVSTLKDEKKNPLPVSFIPSKDKKMGKAQRMHLFSDSGEGAEDFREGDQFSSLRACVVSSAKCRKAVRVVGQTSSILLSERSLDGRVYHGLSMDICLKSRGKMT